MALIGKIRKNFWFVLILLGLALAAFLIMDSQMSGAPGGMANASSPIGSINGKKIDYLDFQRTESSYYGGSTADPFVKRNTIWDYYVENSLMADEAENLGINVSYDELMDLQFGPNPSQIITNNGLTPEDLNSIRTQIEAGELNQQLVGYWKEQENHIKLESLKGKLNNIISKSVYTPNWMAEESWGAENDKVDFNFVKIPFDQLDASGIEVTDADITSFVAKNKAKYEQAEETRSAEYAVFNVLPSQADSSLCLEKINDLKANMMSAENDSLFVISNKGYYTHLYSKKEQLPENAREQVAALNSGEYYGPFEQNGLYMVIKMLDKRSIPDTVNAQHILKRADRNNADQVAKANAEIDSIWNAYRRGGVSFDTLAVRHSDDGSSANGGDLGPFVQETMVPEFTKACFVDGTTNQIKKVQSQFGIHLIKVGDQTYNNRDNKYRFAAITYDIVPSQETQDTQLDKVSELITNNREIEGFKTALQDHPGILVESTTVPIKKNDYALGSLGSGQTPRDMVQWLFDASTELGDVAPEVFSFTDPVKYYDNKYVALSLSSIEPAGMPSTAVLRNQVESEILNQKKGEKFASGLSITSLEDLASQNGVEVQSASGISASRAFVPELGTEPEAVGTAFDLDAQAISKPIVGKTGVIIVQPTNKQDAGAASNLPFLKTSLATATKSQVNFKILENMKKRAKIEDSRSKFF